MFLSSLNSTLMSDGGLLVDLSEENGPVIVFGPYDRGMDWNILDWANWKDSSVEPDIVLVSAAHLSRQNLPIVEYLQGAGHEVLTAHLDGADSNTLRDTLDQLKNKLGSAAIVLASEEGGKVKLIAGVTKDLISNIKAGELVNIAAAEVGGKGGGRPDMAQAGGSDPSGLAAALKSVPDWAGQQLA